jgi:hypothetical protein
LHRLLLRPAVDSSLLAFNLAVLRRLNSRLANLLPLDASGLYALRTSLLTFGPHLHALSALRAFDCSRALNAFDTRGLLALCPRLLTRLRLLAFGPSGLLVLLRPRTGRGADRQSGDTRGEKYPGHHNFSFSTASTATGPRRSHA